MQIRQDCQVQDEISPPPPLARKISSFEAFPSSRKSRRSVNYYSIAASIDCIRDSVRRVICCHIYMNPGWIRWTLLGITRVAFPIYLRWRILPKSDIKTAFSVDPILKRELYEILFHFFINTSSSSTGVCWVMELLKLCVIVEYTHSNCVRQVLQRVDWAWAINAEMNIFLKIISELFMLGNLYYHFFWIYSYLHYNLFFIV